MAARSTTSDGREATRGMRSLLAGWDRLDPALSRLLRINAYALSAAIVVLALAYALGFRTPAALADLVVMVLALALLVVPSRFTARYGASAAMLGLTTSSFAFAVAGTWLTPPLAPLTVMLTLVPLFVGFPYLPARWVTALMVYAVVGGAALAALAEWRRGVGAVSDAWLVNAIVAGVSVPFVVMVVVHVVRDSFQRLGAQSEELRESRRRMVQVADAARRSLERDLHDGAQQRLLAMTVTVGLARKAVRAEDNEQAHHLLDRLFDEAQEVVGEIRELARGIYPPLLTERGLVAAVQAAARRSPVPVTVLVDPFERRPPAVEAAAFFCILEAMTNAVKHARGEDIRIVITADPRLEFVVSDDGRGFDPGAVTMHGLAGMEARMEAAGGELAVTSRRGRGTVVRGRFPV